MKLIHISDTHWHSDDRNNVKQIELVHALEPYREIHYIVDTSDITDDGTEAQYRQAAKWMKPWKWKYHWIFCPGNHDYGWAGWTYAAECAKRFDDLSESFGNGYFYTKCPMLTPIYEGKYCHLIVVLNSNLQTLDPTDFACGEIGQHQLDQLSDILRERNEWTTITLVLHHHPWYHPTPQQPYPEFTMKLIDAEQFLNRIKGKVDILLFGHMHVAGEWWGRWNIPLTLAAPSTPQAGWFNEIVVEGRAIRVNKIQWRV